MDNFKKDAYYKNRVVLFTPHGIVKPGMVFNGEQWQKILVFGIGNCGIDAMFEEIEKPIKDTYER
jgi:hypothetical protein